MTTLLDAWGSLGQFKATPFPPDYPMNVKHIFAPVDQVHEAFIALIHVDDLTSLDASCYGWDDAQINDLFLDALNAQKIPVTLCLDSSQAAGKGEVPLVSKWPGAELGNEVVIGRSSHGAINHDKLIVVNRILTICGSTNFSVGGETKQNNEAKIVFDRAFAGETVNRIQIIRNEMAAQMAAKQGAVVPSS
jgi:hypothetical protein